MANSAYFIELQYYFDPVSKEKKDIWLPAVLPSGHNDAVNDIQWDPRGQFLVSVSSDKTTRLHAPWRKNPSVRITFPIYKDNPAYISRREVH